MRASGRRNGGPRLLWHGLPARVRTTPIPTRGPRGLPAIRWRAHRSTGFQPVHSPPRRHFAMLYSPPLPRHFPPSSPKSSPIFLASQRYRLYNSDGFRRLLAIMNIRWVRAISSPSSLPPLPGPPLFYARKPISAPKTHGNYQISSPAHFLPDFFLDFSTTSGIINDTHGGAARRLLGISFRASPHDCILSRNNRTLTGGG